MTTTIDKLLKRVSTVRSVVDLPAVIAKHHEGTAVPSGIRIDLTIGSKGWGDFASDTIQLQNLGASGIKLLLDSIDIATGEELTIAEAVANGGILIRKGSDQPVNIARKAVIISGADDFILTVVRRF